MVLRLRSASLDIMSEVPLRPSVKPLGRHALRFTLYLLVYFQCIVGISCQQYFKSKHLPTGKQVVAHFLPQSSLKRCTETQLTGVEEKPTSRHRRCEGKLLLPIAQVVALKKSQELCFFAAPWRRLWQKSIAHWLRKKS
jgi:hypothetical protein